MRALNLAIRVISLRGSADRREAVRANLGETPLPWAFLDACGPDDAGGLQADPSEQRGAFGRELTGPETAVFNSHMRVLAEFDTDPSLDWLLVMEDDVWLDPDFPFVELAAFLDERGIGFLRLFCREWRRAYPRYRFGTRQILFLSSDPFGAQGYLISRAAAARFRSRLKTIARPFDDELGRFWENGLENHLIFPFPVIERHMPSTLEDGRAKSLRAKPRDTLHRRRIKLSDYLAKRGYLAWRLSPFAPDRIRPRKR
jgi:glycosyl transferase family 25